MKSEGSSSGIQIQDSISVKGGRWQTRTTADNDVIAHGLVPVDWTKDLAVRLVAGPFYNLYSGSLPLLVIYIWINLSLVTGKSKAD